MYVRSSMHIYDCAQELTLLKHKCRSISHFLLIYCEHSKVIDYIIAQSNCDRIHVIGHSMGGMMAMALVAHPDLHRRILSVTALGSSIFLGHSIGRLLGPFLPMVRVTGGIDLAMGTE